MFKTVVFATDGSETADRALPYAKALATGEGRTLVVIHGRELLDSRHAGNPARADEEDVETKIERQVEEARKDGVDATFKVVSGSSPHAAHMIGDLAAGLGADVIVVGTRGHSPVAGLLLGSVTQRLAQIAHCPVLVVPSSSATRA